MSGRLLGAYAMLPLALPNQRIIYLTSKYVDGILTGLGGAMRVELEPMSTMPSHEGGASDCHSPSVLLCPAPAYAQSVSRFCELPKSGEPGRTGVLVAQQTSRSDTTGPPSVVSQPLPTLGCHR